MSISQACKQIQGPLGTPRVLPDLDSKETITDPSATINVSNGRQSSMLHPAPPNAMEQGSANSISGSNHLFITNRRQDAHHHGNQPVLPLPAPHSTTATSDPLRTLSKYETFLPGSDDFTASGEMIAQSSGTCFSTATGFQQAQTDTNPAPVEHDDGFIHAILAVPPSMQSAAQSHSRSGQSVEPAETSDPSLIHQEIPIHASPPMYAPHPWEGCMWPALKSHKGADQRAEHTSITAYKGSDTGMNGVGAVAGAIRNSDSIAKQLSPNSEISKTGLNTMDVPDPLSPFASAHHSIAQTGLEQGCSTGMGQSTASQRTEMQQSQSSTPYTQLPKPSHASPTLFCVSAHSFADQMSLQPNCSGDSTSSSAQQTTHMCPQTNHPYYRSVNAAGERMMTALLPPPAVGPSARGQAINQTLAALPQVTAPPAQPLSPMPTPVATSVHMTYTDTTSMSTSVPDQYSFRYTSCATPNATAAPAFHPSHVPYLFPQCFFPSPFTPSPYPPFTSTPPLFPMNDPTGGSMPYMPPYAFGPPVYAAGQAHGTPSALQTVSPSLGGPSPTPAVHPLYPLATALAQIGSHTFSAPTTITTPVPVSVQRFAEEKRVTTHPMNVFGAVAQTVAHAPEAYECAVKSSAAAECGGKRKRFSRYEWSTEADKRLLDLVEQHGKRWKLIARTWTGPHSSAQLRNRYTTIQRRLLRRKRAKLRAEGMQAEGAPSAIGAQPSSETPLAAAEGEQAHTSDEMNTESMEALLSQMLQRTQEHQ